MKNEGVLTKQLVKLTSDFSDILILMCWLSLCLFHLPKEVIKTFHTALQLVYTFVGLVCKRKCLLVMICYDDKFQKLIYWLMLILFPHKLGILEL